MAAENQLAKFLDYLRFELNRASLTIEAYELDLRQFIDWAKRNINENTRQEEAGHLEFNFIDVKANDVRGWLVFLSKQGESPRTLRRKIISLRSLFKWMMKNGLIKNSPVENIPLPKIPKPLPDIVKGSEIEEALQNLKSSEEEQSPLEALVIDMLYSLGIRRAELVGLDDSDISFSKGEVKVTGKRSKQRVIPVPQKLLDYIKEWQEYRNRTETMPEGETPLFVVKGKRISPNQVYRIVNKALAGSNARKKSPHALRHSFASGMLNGGAEIDSVREFLGHASLSTTQIYTHISLSEIKKAYTSAHPRSNPGRED